MYRYKRLVIQEIVKYIFNIILNSGVFKYTVLSAC